MREFSHKHVSLWIITRCNDVWASEGVLIPGKYFLHLSKKLAVAGKSVSAILDLEMDMSRKRKIQHNDDEKDKKHNNK